MRLRGPHTRTNFDRVTGERMASFIDLSTVRTSDQTNGVSSDKSAPVSPSLSCDKSVPSAVDRYNGGSKMYSKALFRPSKSHTGMKAIYKPIEEAQWNSNSNYDSDTLSADEGMNLALLPISSSKVISTALGKIDTRIDARDDHELSPHLYLSLIHI